MRGARPQGLVVAGFGLTQIVAFASSFYLMGAIGDAVGRTLSLSPAFVFGTLSLALLVSALLCSKVARWMDRRGGKGVLLASHVVLAAGLALTGAAGNGPTLAAAMAVMGVGMALGLSPTPFAILVSLYGQGARRAITAVALIGGLGSVVGWSITAAVAEALGWRGACFLWAGVELAICLPVSAWVCPANHRQKQLRSERVPSSGRFASTSSRKGRGERPVVWDRTMAQLSVLFACAWFVSTCMSAHLPRLLEQFGLTARAATATAGLMGLAAVGVRFLEFTVLRRAPPLATTRAATLMHPAGAAALETLGGAGAAAMAVGQGAGNGMLTVAKGVLPLSLYGPSNYAYRSALLTRPALFAQVAGPSVYALALERSEMLALGLSSGLCLVMFAMTFGLSRKPSHEEEHVPA